MKTYTAQQVTKVQKMIKSGASYAEVSRKLNIPSGSIPYLNKKNVNNAVQTKTGHKGAAKRAPRVNTNNVWATIASFIRPHLQEA